MANNNTGLIEVNEQIIVSSNVLKILIPVSYFEDEISKYNGGKLSTLGIFYFYPLEKDSNNYSGLTNLQFLKMPYMIEFEFTNVEDAEIEIKGKTTKYVVLTLLKGNVLLDNVNFQQKPGDVYIFYKLLNKGKFDNVKYSELIKLFYNVLFINGVNLGVPSLILEGSIAELCRVPDDTSIPFRKIAGKGKVDEYNYMAISDKNLAHFSNTFGSLTFEDFNKAVILSLERGKSKKKEFRSPIEDIIRNTQQ